MTFLDLFAGVGGFRRGMELAGHKCLGFCEWDKYARMSYISMHCITDEQRAYLATLDMKQRQKEILKDEYLNGEWCSTDIRAVDAGNIPRADCWCFGAPCQDFSIAGKRKGLEGDRSSLIREVFRVLNELKEEDKPRWLIYENVKGMLSSNGGWDFFSIICEMDVGGYDVQWQLLNTKLHGIPQNRERVYTIGHIRGDSGGEIFPLKAADREDCAEHQQKGLWGGKLFKQYPGEKFLSMNDAFMTDIGTDTASTVTARYYKGLGNHKDNLVVKQIGRLESDKRDNPNPYRVYDADGIAPTLNCAGGGAENLTLQLGSGALQEPHEITRNEIGGVLQQGKTLMARDYKGIGNQGMTGVLHLINQQNPMCAPAQILSQHEKTEEYQTKNKQEPQ